MAMKLHRGRKKVFRRKNTALLRGVVTAAACVVLVGCGILLASAMLHRAPDNADPGKPTGSSVLSTTVSTTAAPLKKPSARRAFFVPIAQLHNTAALEKTLTEAAAAGFNTVVFDLKNADGAVLYASATELAATAGSVAGDALTPEQLKAAAALCRGKGIEPVPRVFAFRDATAPHKLTDARVKLAGNSSTMWLDNKQSNGGKPWLNPCAKQAHLYIRGLCTELNGLGFSTLLIDGVQYPEKESRADYGDNTFATMEKSAVLTRFVAYLQKAVGADNTLIFAMRGTAVLGTDTAGFGGNPLSFGAANAAPQLQISALGKKLKFDGTTVKPAADPAGAIRLAVAQMQAYTAILNVSPTLMPWIEATDTAATVISAELGELTAAGIPAYLVYSETGTYDFAHLKDTPATTTVSKATTAASSTAVTTVTSATKATVKATTKATAVPTKPTAKPSAKPTAKPTANSTATTTASTTTTTTTTTTTSSTTTTVAAVP